ncbi:hypothetical protein CK203_064585 [Vitis vinifera]|uniref:Uncharacterized protein n=1 Tax=Vitis vinifera TaxID=29760 RepID=A0A438G786_VITVI|nr:hypothetical protein CK203_064585 [Vitis vinifera]
MVELGQCDVVDRCIEALVGGHVGYGPHNAPFSMCSCVKWSSLDLGCNGGVIERLVFRLFDSRPLRAIDRRERFRVQYGVVVRLMGGDPLSIENEPFNATVLVGSNSMSSSAFPFIFSSSSFSTLQRFSKPSSVRIRLPDSTKGAIKGHVVLGPWVGSYEHLAQEFEPRRKNKKGRLVEWVDYFHPCLASSGSGLPIVHYLHPSSSCS